jgi:hypothetical protein
MRGAAIIDVGADGLEAARAALARALASGALGPGYRVARDGHGLTFEGARSDGADGGRIEVTADGRVTWDVRLRGAERLRVVQAVGVAAMVAVVGTLAFGWLAPVALAVGGAGGVVWAGAAIAGDRARVRAHVRALVASLPALLER